MTAAAIFPGCAGLASFSFAGDFQPLAKGQFINLTQMESVMEKKIQWETEIGKAKKRAQAENKPIFLDFFNPQ
jgi:hypothetical protein